MTRFALPSLIALGLGWAYWPTLEFLFGKWRDDPQVYGRLGVTFKF